MARQRPQMPTFHAIQMQQAYSPNLDHTMFSAPPATAARPAQQQTHAPIPDQVREALVTGAHKAVTDHLSGPRHTSEYNAMADSHLPIGEGRHIAPSSYKHAGEYRPEVPGDGRGDHIPRHAVQPSGPGAHKAGEHRGPRLSGRVWSATKKWMMNDPNAA